MTTAATSARFGGWRATMARWLLLCVVVRALLPVGFMPDFGNAADDSFHFVICASDGTGALASHSDGAPSGDQTGKTTSEPCAFAGLAHLWQPLPVGLTIAPPVRIAHVVPLPPEVAPLAFRTGPQLGARAPPRISRTIA